MQADTNYIYILLVLAYVIYSIIKAGKKITKNRPAVNKPSQSSPTVSPAQPPPGQERGDDFKKMLEELLGGNPEENAPEEQIPEPVKITPPLPKKEKKLSQQPNQFQQKKTKTAEPAPFLSREGKRKVPIAPVEIADAEEEAQIDFDVRQAVIYSEILKRPHY